MGKVTKIGNTLFDNLFEDRTSSTVLHCSNYSLKIFTEDTI